MGNRLLKDLPVLIEKGIITDDVADDIREYYSKDSTDTKARLHILLAVLGALLVGLGILLILAHNWDTLSKSVKSVLAFIPLIASHLLVLYVLLKRSNDKMWSEAVAIFNYTAIAISISLISQIYHIDGSFDDFMLLWMLLALPIVYLLNSSILSLLYIGGITVFVANTSWLNSFSLHKSLLFIPLLILILPYYFILLKKSKFSNFTYFHNWFIPLSVAFSFPFIVEGHSQLIILLLFCLFAIIYFIGKMKLLQYGNLLKNGYIIIGIIGTMILLYIISFEDYWSRSFRENALLSFGFNTYFVGSLLIIASILLIKRFISRKVVFDPVDWAFLAFAVFYLIVAYLDINISIPVVFFNLFVLFIGVTYILKGEKHSDLIAFNIGLLTISILIIVRFFDYDISFLVRGLIFIILGIAFFVANFLLIRKRKKIKS